MHFYAAALTHMCVFCARAPMEAAAPRGQVQTVLGPISTESVGTSLMHEHLFIDFTKFYKQPEGEEAPLGDAKIALSNLHWVQYHGTASRSIASSLLSVFESSVSFTLRTWKRAQLSLLRSTVLSHSSTRRNSECFQSICIHLSSCSILSFILAAFASYKHAHIYFTPLDSIFFFRASSDIT